MPALVPRAHEIRRAADRRADLSGIDQLAAGLVRTAEKCVRRGTDPQLLLRCTIDQLLAVLEGDAERLFRIDMLAGVECLQPDRDMGLRNGEVEDDLDPRIGE